MISKKHKTASTSEPLSDDAFELELSPPTEILTNGAFLNSVDQLATEDITPPASLPKKRKGGGIVRTLFLLLFSAAFVVSCGLLVKDAFSKSKAAEIYRELEEEFFGEGFEFTKPLDNTSSNLTASGSDAPLASLSNPTATTPAPDDTTVKGNYNEELQKMRAGLASLAEINPDVYGWITVSNTNINYPLVQGTDNDYYLNHAYTGDYLPEGSIFVDYRNRQNISANRNTVFYGHNLRTGGMFHDVTKFADADFMANSLIYVYTYDGVFIYEPFSFYESRYDYNYFRTHFSSGKELVAFAEEVLGNSAVTMQGKEITFNENDRLLTLSTCTNGYYTQRYALHARLIEVITD